MEQQHIAHGLAILSMLDGTERFKVFVFLEKVQFPILWILGFPE